MNRQRKQSRDSRKYRVATGYVSDEELQRKQSRDSRKKRAREQLPPDMYRELKQSRDSRKYASAREPGLAEAAVGSNQEIVERRTLSSNLAANALILLKQSRDSRKELGKVGPYNVLLR